MSSAARDPAAPPGPPAPSALRAAVTWLTFPLVLFGGTALVAVGVPGVDPLALAPATIFGAWLLLFALERACPETLAWRVDRRTFVLDVFHNTLSAGAVGKGVEAGLVVLLASLAGPWQAGVWPADWPLGLQIPLALVIHDVGVYWAHRTFHVVPRLWSIHALHHSSERLHALSTGRSHPFNVAIYQLLSLTPLLLLGAGERLLLITGVCTALIGMLQHANVPMRCGVFNLIFATPDLHRWHHSVVLEESNTNFGGNLIVWDWVFGTRFLPADRVARHEVGIDNVRFPERLGDHLLSPFRLRGWEAAFAAEAGLGPAQAAAAVGAAPESAEAAAAAEGGQG